MGVIPSHVLVPLDGSPVASDALDHAFDTFDCRVTVLNVVTPLDAGMSEGADFLVDRDRIADAEARAADLVATAKQEGEHADRTVETAIETGDPAETILSYVDDQAVDHIVMGRHGEGGGELSRSLLGTVSTAVVGEASIPVTVVG